MKFSIKAEEIVFEFESELEEAAWYEFDKAEIEKDGYIIRIDADRDAYAFLIKDNEEKWGVLRDQEGNTIPDNYPIEETEYLFEEIKDGCYV